MNKEQLTARAQELSIQVPEGATNNQISDLIKIAEHPVLFKDLKIQKDLEEKAKKDKAEETKKLVKAENEIKALKKQLEEVSTITNQVKGVTYKDESGEYEFTVAKFRFKGPKYNAEDAVKDDSLMKALIESKFTGLKKVK